MGSKICARSSAQTDRHRLTSWSPVALMGVISGSAEKWPKIKNNGIEKPPWSTTKKTLISIDTDHRQKPAPTTSDCGHDPKIL